MAFARGAIPTPRHKLLAAAPHVIVAVPPPQFSVVPKQLSPWGNEKDGDCVSAEEAFAKAWWSVFCGLPETFIPEAEVVRWASKYGFLNGAGLTEVMDEMSHDGFTVDTHNYKDGGYKGVDYSNEDILHSALTVGPVKIAIDANALPDSAGFHNGWWTVNSNRHTNPDHCVGIGGYGPASYLFDQLGVPLPAGLTGSTPGYHLFTWSSIGFVTYPWIMGTCVEAWVRNPTTLGQVPGPTPVPPVPVPPGPTPIPPVPTPTNCVKLSEVLPIADDVFDRLIKGFHYSKPATAALNMGRKDLENRFTKLWEGR